MRLLHTMYLWRISVGHQRACLIANADTFGLGTKLLDILPNFTKRQNIWSQSSFGIFLYLILWVQNDFCEARTILKNQSKVITVSDVNSVGYRLPLDLEESKQFPSLLNDDTLFDKDWLLQNSSEASEQAAVLDKRWEDFGTNYTDYQHFSPQRSLSISLYSPGLVKIYVNDNDNLNYQERRPENNTWVHYTFQFKNGQVHIFENSNLNPNIFNLKPTSVVIKTPEKTYRKVHEFPMRVAYNRSTNPTNIFIPTTEKSIFVLNVLLCPHCKLEVYISGDLIKVFSLTTSWQRLEINEKSKLNMTLVRKTTNDFDDVFWAIDLRKYPAKGVIQQFTSNEEFTWHTLNQINVRNVPNEHHFLPCPDGGFGKECKLKCTDILSSTNTHCKGYKICTDSTLNCTCAWGYQGPTCDQRCDDGKWGLNCNNACKTCRNCDRHTGSCQFNHSARLLTSRAETPAIKTFWMLHGIMVLSFFWNSSFNDVNTSLLFVRPNFKTL